MSKNQINNNNNNNKRNFFDSFNMNNTKAYDEITDMDDFIDDELL